MLIIRLAAIAFLLGSVLSLLVWMLTGHMQYRRMAWFFFIVGLVAILVFLLFLVYQRLTLQL